MISKSAVRCSSRCFSKKVSCFILLLMFLGYSPFMIYDIYVTSVEIEFYNLHMEDGSDSSSESQCVIPDYDPYDPCVTKYLSSPPAIQCGQPQPYLTYVDSDGFIHLNKTTIKNSGHEESDYECHYFEIFRTNKSDNKFSLAIPKVFKKTEKIRSSAFVLVKCFLKSADLVYESGHVYVPPPSAELYTASRRNGDDVDHPSVLIFGVDSMSRLNFIRQLPKTYRILTKVLGAIIFKGMTKTGDNTFPNMMALLSGINFHKSNNKMNSLSVNKPTYFDDIPIVWDSFRASGYATMYNEDSPSLTVFNFHASGFKDQPTDYYVRPFWLAMNSINNFNSKDSRCYGNTPKHKYLLDYIEQFAARMKKHRYFAFTFLTLLSHDDLNEVQVADSDFENMFLKMQREGQLNNTIVIMLGDHGHRFSEIRKTDIGRVEERMPFLAVSLPTEFKHRYPHLVEGLEQNHNTLLSWFDVHEMLMDLTHNNLGKKSTVQRYGKIGSSPFRQIPKNRTCEEAGIPDEYCICARERSLNTNDKRVKTAARALVAHINSDLLGSTVDQGVCSTLHLRQILSAQMLSLGVHVAQPKGFRVLYRVTVQVMPSKALFEGTVQADAWSKQGNIVGDVNRINRYGNQSHCVSDKIVQLYCYCTDLLGENHQNEAQNVIIDYESQITYDLTQE